MKVVKTIRSWNLPLEGLLTQNKNTKMKGKKMEEVEKKGVRPDGYKATDEEVAQQEEMIERKGLNDVAVAENATTTSNCKDSIHRAMVLIAGIEMENPEDPPRLWTALEDAWDALCDALGTDGDVSADVAEAKAIGRHFVVKPSGNVAKMREALKQAQRVLHCAIVAGILKGEDAHEALNVVTAALSDPPRNCDVGNEYNQVDRFVKFCRKHEKGCGLGWGSEGVGHPKVTCSAYKNIDCGIVWAQMPYEKEGEE